MKFYFLREFHQDFVNHLMPAVEGQFHTYAQSVNQEERRQTRYERRAGVYIYNVLPLFFGES